ncbi:UNVERIFIED_CONTAM: hypothetical protein GTU68_063339 [Idotea baltica]|nr:hypothetical protein [Idotea baltica]
MGEAMHALGVPTTRALAAVTTGEDVARDGIKPCAVLTRIASSHLRVGTFQFFAARKEWDKIRKLADYAIARHYPELATADNKYLGFLSAVLERQASLVAKWLHTGFVHGVMNTDNMTISGETIDYGPCAFVDTYDPKAVFSSIDRDGRYSFGNQPVIAQWNLTRLAETLLPLIDPDDKDNSIRLASNEISGFVGRYTKIWTDGMRAKIGLTSDEENDTSLINDLFTVMEEQSVDYTMFFRHLADAALGDTRLKQWQDRLLRDPQSPAERAEAMNKVNPIYIPRNHRVEEALTAAEAGDISSIETLLKVLSDPFTKRDGLGSYEGPAPDDFGPYKTFCGT